MFVSVIVEPGGMDSAKSLVNILTMYGFKKIQRSCWECMSINEETVSSLKKDVDRVTDYYDKIRMYQFPVNGLFVITELKQKKWKKAQFKAPDRPASPSDRAPKY
ncbi:CRISPR-associated endonuclease Cas2 [Treponema sp.]|uniref:CRISPR-associated endonuclease Cas2 n=1 Tax=Treponema sp. TaxID=166 RepID=UPI0025F31CFA|nr:CRISPR-associated endonuclease Cas2 [Treponema sp.]MCR5219131.1 CRISPR-associated endonuclease Cas2 [Treponema sp.]